MQSFLIFNPIYLSVIDGCRVWVPIDRTLVILSSIYMIIGAVHYDRMLFGPYLLWCLLDTVVNMAICLLLAKVIGYYVYFAWVIVCFEIYSGFIVLSEFRAIPFKLKTLQEYLDNLKLYERNRSRREMFRRRQHRVRVHSEE